tara:strand:+ start:1721 stop:1936 length:216 start_codon:yes stop_codon:yes gene_type:complete
VVLGGPIRVANDTILTAGLDCVVTLYWLAVFAVLISHALAIENIVQVAIISIKFTMFFLMIFTSIPLCYGF